MTAIAKGRKPDDDKQDTFLSYDNWLYSRIPLVKAYGNQLIPDIDLYNLTFGFRKIHIGDLPRGRYKFTLREHESDFVKIHRDVGGNIIDYARWKSADDETKPYVRLTYIAVSDDERRQMETFIDDYLDHCEEAESKFERACFDTSSSWAKEQPWYNFISNPQLMVIHNMDHTLGRFKKPWREAYGKNAKKGKRYTMVSAKEKKDTVRGTKPKDPIAYLNWVREG